MKLQPNHKMYKTIASITVFFLFFNSVNCQKSISDEAAFLWKIKYDSLPTNEYTEEYLFRFEKDNYRLYINDEFEMHLAENKLIEMVDELKENGIFTIKHTAELGEYNFEKKGFSCSPIKESENLSLLEYEFGARLPTHTSIELHFLNSTEIEFLCVDEEVARDFIKERKNYKNGKIDRSITLNISFVLNGLYSVENITNKSRSILTANILQIEFYNEDNLSNEPLGIVSTNYKDTYTEITKLGNELNALTSEAKNAKLIPNESDNELIISIKKILSNTTLDNDSKATLIKSTIELYQGKPENVSASN